MNPALFDMIMRLRSGGISDNRVLKAMETVPRHRFISGQYSDFAYDERSLPIACGQILSEPLTVAVLTQAADVQDEHKVLEIGTGSGYHSAILAQLCKRVYSVERFSALTEAAQATLRDLEIVNVTARHGDGRYGWRGQAPFDRIIVTAGLNAPPGTLFGQLKSGGSLTAVVDGVITRYSKAKVKMTETRFFEAKVPLLEAGKSKAL